MVCLDYDRNSDMSMSDINVYTFVWKIVSDLFTRACVN